MVEGTVSNWQRIAASFMTPGTNATRMGRKVGEREREAELKEDPISSTRKQRSMSLFCIACVSSSRSIVSLARSYGFKGFPLLAFNHFVVSRSYWENVPAPVLCKAQLLTMKHEAFK